MESWLGKVSLTYPHLIHAQKDRTPYKCTFIDPQTPRCSPVFTPANHPRAERLASRSPSSRDSSELRAAHKLLWSVMLDRVRLSPCEAVVRVDHATQSRAVIGKRRRRYLSASPSTNFTHCHDVPHVQGRKFSACISEYSNELHRLIW